MRSLNTMIACAASCIIGSAQLQAVNIVPVPTSVKETRTIVRLPSDRLGVHAADKQLRHVAQVWGESLEKPYEAGTVELESGFERIVSPVVLPEVRLCGRESDADVRLAIDDSLGDEAYVLEIAPESVVVRGGSAAGVWWGLQTMTQLLVQAAEASAPGQDLQLSGLVINDSPRFAYRGAHLDCCRHFFTVDEVKKFIDIMSLHKLNTLHWHLTDDQGWRIEIRKYPLLTEIGAVRAETKVGHYDDTEAGYDGTPYGEGCYYTAKDVKEILEYASDRQVTVIPEIEMPGHAVAALASYPWLGCRGEGYEVRETWGISDDVFCIGKESTFDFLEDVLDEVCEMFPSEYIHIGGDECPSIRWKDCPDCRKRMEAEGLESERQLQGYLLHRIEQYLNAKGRKIIGWDEILEGGVTPTATVMSWRGPKGGITAANKGNDVVMTPNNYFYLDYYQTADPKKNGEPQGIGGYVSLEKSYSFDPYDRLDDNARKHIKGIQANTWTEYIATFDHLQHMDLPRFSALSEIAWSSGKTSYEDFLGRVTASLKPLYEYYGFIYAPYVFEGIE